MRRSLTSSAPPPPRNPGAAIGESAAHATASIARSSGWAWPTGVDHALPRFRHTRGPAPGPRRTNCFASSTARAPARARSSHGPGSRTDVVAAALSVGCQQKSSARAPCAIASEATHPLPSHTTEWHSASSQHAASHASSDGVASGTTAAP